MEPSYATLQIAAPSECCLSLQTLELLLAHFGVGADGQCAPKYWKNSRTTSPSGSVTSVPHSEPYLSVSRRNMTGLCVCWPQRAFRCCNTTCGSNNGALSVLKQMQTAGEVSNTQLDHFKRIYQRHHCLWCGVWSVSATSRERATHWPKFGGEFTVLDLSLSLRNVAESTSTLYFST